MTLTVLGLGLLVILGVVDGCLHQVLDVTLDVLPEVEHVGVGRPGSTHRGKTVLLAILHHRLLGEPIAGVAAGCLDAVVLADVIIHLVTIVLNVSQFRLRFVRDVIMFFIF